MSCLGQCGDCNCEKLDVCKPRNEIVDSMDSKLKVIKDYACLLAQTTCVNLPKRVGQFAYFLWCLLRDMYILIKNTIKRVDNLCEVSKCQEEKINAIIKYLISTLQDNVEFKMHSSGTVLDTGSSPDTYTKIDTTNDGSFTIRWNMVVIDVGEAGKGTIKGKVNHSYTPNDDGTITAHIDSVTIQSAVYTTSGAVAPSTSASFAVRDESNNIIWSRAYNPMVAWSESINKTVKLNKNITLQPNGGTHSPLFILKTYDNWDSADTVGNIHVQYINNNKPVILPRNPCPINCTMCEQKED